MAANSKRTPTVRRIKPAITPVARPRAVPTLGGRPGGPPASGLALVAEPSGLDPLGGRPVDLGVDLGRGLVLGNPVLVASGPFGYGVEVADAVDLARLGGLVTRSTSVRPRGGHPGPRMAEVPAGVLLGMGPQNPGLETVLERYAAAWADWPVPVILSLCADTAAELGEAARRLEAERGIAGLEVNLSCGRAGRGGAVPGLDAEATASWVAAVRRATDLPLIAKLTAQAPDVAAVARAAAGAGADAISAINTLPGLLPAADRRRPALGSGYGGICGPVLRPIALRVVHEVAGAVDVPVIGVGGVACLDDILDFLAVGAGAVAIGVAALADPMLPVRLADELADACRERGVRSVGELVGTMASARSAPPSTRGAEYAR